MKKRNKNMPTPRQDVIDNPIPTSLFLSDMHFVDAGHTKKLKLEDK